MPSTNTLTGIIPTMYEALNVVSREMVGFIPAVRRDSNAERAAVDQTVRVPMAEAGDLEDITPGADPANSGGTTLEYVDVKVTKSKAAPVLWNGEEELGVGSNGTFNRILADQFSDAMRKLVNAVEVDLALAAKLGASRAYGTAGTAPFGTAGELDDFAGVAQILDDNGSPLVDRQIALNSSAMANLRGKQSVLFKVNEAGSDDMLRNGITDRIQNFALRYSGGFASHTKGTGASYLTNLSEGYAVGAKTIAADTGTGTILAGDVINFADDSPDHSYVVKTALADGSLVLQDPGLMSAIVNNKAISLAANYTPNVAFSRSAIVLAARAPAIPSGGDSADDSMMLTDPVTGMTFEIRVYRQYRRIKYEVCLAWGVKAIKPEHIALLLG